MKFLYILSGWVGSVADAVLYLDAYVYDLRIPEGKCYLADTGFSSSDATLVPYRGVRYHLAEWGRVLQMEVEDGNPGMQADFMLARGTTTTQQGLRWFET
jgi:hypothetical protein